MPDASRSLDQRSGKLGRVHWAQGSPQPRKRISSMQSRSAAVPRTDVLVSTVAVVSVALLTALAAQVSITLPGTPVPQTLQTMAVLGGSAYLGSRRGLAAMLLVRRDGPVPAVLRGRRAGLERGHRSLRRLPGRLHRGRIRGRQAAGDERFPLDGDRAGDAAGKRARVRARPALAEALGAVRLGMDDPLRADGVHRRRPAEDRRRRRHPRSRVPPGAGCSIASGSPTAPYPRARPTTPAAPCSPGRSESSPALCRMPAATPSARSRR